MTFTPPFTINGTSLESLQIQQATLTLRSLDADTLEFSLRDNAKWIPADDQWLALKDANGATIFTGISKRAYRYPQRIYNYTVSNVYKGMMETPLVEHGRAYVLYPSGGLGARLRDILGRGITAGLPFAVATNLPSFYDVPKQSFRSSSIASALEDTLKWAPDTVSRMDYSTSPPTLRLYARGQRAVTVLDFDSQSHRATSVELVPYPEARALAISFAYARRSGNNIVNYLVQNAGNDSAEAGRKISLYLSGTERTDLFVAEALSTSQRAVAISSASMTAANNAVAAVNAAIAAQYAAALAAIPGLSNSFDAAAYVSAADSALSNSSLNWLAAGFTVSGYQSPGIGLGSQDTNRVNFSEIGLSYSRFGWPVSGNPFTSAQLTTAGATSNAGTITGNMVADVSDGHGNRGFPDWCSYYGAGYYPTSASASDDYHQWVYHPVNVSVNFLSKSPSVIRAALTAAAAAAAGAGNVPNGVGTSAFIDRAEFVEAPPNLAANYFARQDWTPYKGRLAFTPAVADKPAPGSFISIRGEAIPADWSSMAAPVAELSLDLRTGVASVSIGPSPRMDFSSLVDRLRIPPEDNYEAG